MKRLVSLAAVLLTGLLCLPIAASAAAVAGATVALECTDVVLCASVTVPPPATTDAEGAFSFDPLAAAPWLLKVEVMDSSIPPAIVKTAQVNFAVTTAPARLAGRVTTLDGADVSLQVNAVITAAGTGGIVLDAGYPKVQPAWNLNWLHANGKLIVRLAGTGLENLTEVSLTSAAGTVSTTTIRYDPLLDEYRAVFAKRAAFAALVPASAVRGDVVAVTVGLTTPVGTDTFDTSFRVVGPKKRRP